MSEYEANAEKIAKKLGLKVTIKEGEGKRPAWKDDEKHTFYGTHYEITLTLRRKRLAFDFWGSNADADKGEDPSVYDVLSCVASDASSPTDPDEVAAEFGEGMKPSQCVAVAEFAKKLQRFFTEDEITKLTEIQ